MSQATAVSQNPLATENVNKLIVKFAIPSVISFLVSALYNVVDQIFIGQGVGLLGNAATNVAFPLSTICTSVYLLLGLGSATGFNLNMGTGNRERAFRIAGNGITLLAIVGVLIGLITFIFLKPLMVIFGATGEVMPYALTYTGITALGFPFLIFSSGCGPLIRADGRPTYSMICVLSGAILNTILDPILIFIFDMGMAGAAIATVMGQMLSCLLAIIYLTRFKAFRITRRYLRPTLKNSKTIVTLGAASFFNQVAMTVTQVVMNNTLTFYGAASLYGAEIPLASVGVIAKVNVFLMAFILGTCHGCQPIFGFNYGAKNYQRVKLALRTALITVTCLSLLAFVAFQVFPRQIVALFGSDTELYFQFATRYMRIFMFLTFANGIIPITSTLFTSIGKPTKGIFVSLTRQILFLVPLLLLLPMFMGIDGVVFAGPIADGVAVIVTTILTYQEIKKMRR